MYNYAEADSIFYGVSNIYLFSIVTAFLAVIIALYYSNFLKDENEHLNHTKVTYSDEGNDDETEDEVQEFYVESDCSDESELETRYIPQRQTGATCYGPEDYDECNSVDECSSNDDDEDLQTDGLVGKLKSKRVKELEAQLTRAQLEEERRIEREQLAAIFELLKKQEAELNMKEIDENELNAQLSLYR